MIGPSLLIHGGAIFDGQTLLTDHAVICRDGRVTYLGSLTDAPDADRDIDLQGDTLAPGFVDVQVNGGDGILFNDDPSPETLQRMAAAHRRLGVTTLLPTLITDTPEITRAAIEAAIAAVAQGMPGICGVHLEGPHLSVARKGAHDAGLVRPMTDADLQALLTAAPDLSVLKVTIAPESVSLAQVRTLSRAGIVVSLGHSDADYETCMAYADAGAQCATHLFNAMSPLTSRAPGLVGAALDHGGLSAGLIADGIHVHPATIRSALAAKKGPGRVFLVSDAMACAGSEITRFTLGGREILRAEGRLTLADGTLAGADLDLARAVQVMVQEVGVTLEQALAAATSIPARAVGLPRDCGVIVDGGPADLIRLGADFSLVDLPLPLAGSIRPA